MKVSILGCGWLGLPLGESLSKGGATVKGSTTHPEKLDKLASSGITPYLLTLLPKLDGDLHFFKSDVIIINLPPRNQAGQSDYHEVQLTNIREEIKKNKITNVLFISSTAVYPEQNRIVYEEDAKIDRISRRGVSLLKMEQLFTFEKSFSTTVLRFGGLYGPQRHPGRFLAGKKDLSGANNPVNMVHLDDCMGIIKKIITLDIWGQTFNACSPNHPTRRQFYEMAAIDLGIEPPTFSTEDSPYKIVSSDKLIKMTGYQFNY